MSCFGEDAEVISVFISHRWKRQQLRSQRLRRPEGIIPSEKVISPARESWFLITIVTSRQLRNQEHLRVRQELFFFFYLSTPWHPLTLLTITRLSRKWTNHSVAHSSPAALSKQANQSLTTNLSSLGIAHFSLFTMKWMIKKKSVPESLWLFLCQQALQPGGEGLNQDLSGLTPPSILPLHTR